MTGTVPLYILSAAAVIHSICKRVFNLLICKDFVNAIFSLINVCMSSIRRNQLIYSYKLHTQVCRLYGFCMRNKLICEYSYSILTASSRSTKVTKH